VAEALTVTSTGIVMDTFVPVIAMAPLYCPAAVNDDVLKATDKVAGFAWLTLKLAAESMIHDWFAFTVSETAAVDAVLN
jgi:hypothetical protein